ncbi:MAG: hypothetical protein HUU02_03320, partial [Bacteroidetes bacterium]|nr:hypothetical protein [Bacteroidota bacterium]
MKIWNRIPVSILLVMTLGIFSCEDPNGPGSEYTVTVTGRAVTSITGSGIDSIVVTLDVPFRKDTANTDGS